jgi:hypothetical protein
MGVQLQKRQLGVTSFSENTTQNIKIVKISVTTVLAAETLSDAEVSIAVDCHTARCKQAQKSSELYRSV